MSVLHVHFVDDKDIHVANAQGRAVGIAPGPFDVKFSTGKTGTVHFDLGWIGGVVDLLVDVTTVEGVKASTRIQDVVDPITRPDLQFIFKIPGAKGSQAAEARAKLEAAWAENKMEIVGAGLLLGLGAMWFAAQQVKKQDARRQEMMMMMAMSRAPPEVATSHLATGMKAAKTVALKAAKPMKILKAKFKRVTK